MSKTPRRTLKIPAIACGAKPRLTVDVGPLLETFWTGIPVFTRRLVQALLVDGRVDLSYCFNLTELPAAIVHNALAMSTGAFLRLDYETRAYASYRPADTSTPLLYPSNKKVANASPREASVVHDISTLVMPENHELANVEHHMESLAQELASDELVLCASEATKAALTTYFPSVAPKMRIMHQYVDWPESFAIMDHNLPRAELGRYAVVVGTIEPRKNLSILLHALSLPELRNSDLKFVIIGKVGWLVEGFLEALTPAQRERLIFTGFVSEFVKYRLIAHAEFMVFPSLYEGFGIPALEALSLGKPVLAARTSSFPEVIGPAGVYFDPLSVTEFAAALAEIEAPARLAELKAHTHAQAALFTPARMAAPVLEWVGVA
jgi:hypothetical protein